jgi:hypothetical protein
VWLEKLTLTETGSAPASGALFRALAEKIPSLKLATRIKILFYVIKCHQMSSDVISVAARTDGQVGCPHLLSVAIIYTTTNPITLGEAHLLAMVL